MAVLIAPSLLSANFLKLSADVQMINSSVADFVHCDVMDGVFVPNISFGFPVISAVHKIAEKPLDVHLMIVQPERYFEAFKEAGASMLSIHFEANTHLHRSLRAIRNLGMKAGIVLSPHTPVHVLESIIEEADFVLIMSVNPGYGGQQFIEHTYHKIAKLKEMIFQRGLSTQIEVDGGVSVSNAGRLVQAGADILVAGNAIFADKNPSRIIEQLKNCS